MKINQFTWTVVTLNCAVPASLLVWDALAGNLGANPVDFAIRTTGLLALIFLTLSLAITPVSRITGWSWLVGFRRTLGLFAFFHTCLHFLIFFILDRDASISGTLSEVLKRPYLLVGMFGLVLMAPLAATSTNGMIRRLGGKRWKALHRLAYLAAIAGVVHFTMLVKADLSRPIAFGAVLAVLLGYRVVSHELRLRSAYGMLQEQVKTPVASSRPRFWTGRLRVARIFDETPEVRTFRLVPETGDRLPFDFHPGQYLNLSLMIDGKRVTRSYTIASPPTRIGSCELTIKREAKGVSSRHLHEMIQEGSLLDISAPAGRFTFNGTEAESIVMIAGGVGITPLMAKIRYLTDLGWSGAIDLIYSVKTERDIIFRDELTLLQQRFPNLRVHVTLTQDTGSIWSGERGRITRELVLKKVPEIATRRVHLCGPSAMTEPMVEMLHDLGVAPDLIKTESFTRASRTEPTTTSRPIGLEHNGTNGHATLTFARSGKTTIMPEQRTVLEASEDLGIPIDFDCRSGICGQCKTRLISGNVTMEIDDALDPVDRANNFILSCQARCLDEVLIEA